MPLTLFNILNVTRVLTDSKQLVQFVALNVLEDVDGHALKTKCCTL